jgi:predicted ATPase
MRRWRLLQLEPSALRRSDEISRDPVHIGPDGAHMPATLYRLATQTPETEPNQSTWESRIYATVANRLAELVDGVGNIRVYYDKVRRQLTLMMEDQQGIELPASSLSDGTLRFLALTILEMDPEESGILCLEEPENGIHPVRIKAILRLLNDIAVGTKTPVGSDNPMRQVIINTHSPSVVSQVDDTSLIFSEAHIRPADSGSVAAMELLCVENTIRSKHFKMKTIQRGKILDYLTGNLSKESDDSSKKSIPHRIIDRYGDIIQMVLFDKEKTS